MSSIIVLSPNFNTTLSRVASVSAVQTVISQFTTIRMNTVNSDVGNNWDVSNSHYIVPSTGLYQVTGTIRTDNSQHPEAPFGVGVHTENVDGDWFLQHFVQITIGSSRNTTAYPYIRTDFFEAGQRLRMFCYAESTEPVSFIDAALNIFRIV